MTFTDVRRDVCAVADVQIRLTDVACVFRFTDVACEFRFTDVACEFSVADVARGFCVTDVAREYEFTEVETNLVWVSACLCKMVEIAKRTWPSGDA